MRKFKFRAYNKDSFTYFDLDLLNDESRAFYINEIKDNQVMQYTGLKDKNNVEIYEGDILEAFDILGEREIYPVIFIDGAFMGKRLDDEEFPYFYLFANKSLSKTYKVIGNIYKNPELLSVI